MVTFSSFKNKISKILNENEHINQSKQYCLAVDSENCNVNFVISFYFINF
jgi:hypothetical protein